jgi:hypothetical protein
MNRPIVKIRRSSKLAVLAALMGGSLSLFASAKAHGALLSVGAPNGTFGGYVCADVRNGSLTNSTVVQAYDCHAGQNQQFELSGNASNSAIFALGGKRCLNVPFFKAGAAVRSNICNGAPNQAWSYVGGNISPAYDLELCLDATSMANFTQLVVNFCNGATSQQWQIK